MQEKEALKLERARQRRIERQLREEREAKMLKEAISGLQDQDENHMNHREQAETQRGLNGYLQQLFPLARIFFLLEFLFLLMFSFQFRLGAVSSL